MVSYHIGIKYFLHYSPTALETYTAFLTMNIDINTLLSV